MAQKTTRSRAAALRAAKEAKAARDRERREREEQIEGALADFYEGATAAARVRSDAKERAERIIGDAEAKASLYDAQAGEAIRALRALDQTNAEIAELCGLTPAEVRALASGREEGSAGRRALASAETREESGATDEHDEAPGTDEVTGEAKEGEPGGGTGENDQGTAAWTAADR